MIIFSKYEEHLCNSTIASMMRNVVDIYIRLIASIWFPNILQNEKKSVFCNKNE